MLLHVVLCCRGTWLCSGCCPIWWCVVPWWLLLVSPSLLTCGGVLCRGSPWWCCVSLCGVVQPRGVGGGPAPPARGGPVHKAARRGAVPGTRRGSDRPHGAPLGAPAGSVLLAGGRRPAPGLLEQLQPRVPLGPLHGGGPAQRLPGHHLPALRGGPGGGPRHGALRPLPGGARGVRGLRAPLQGADPLGVQQAGRPARPGALLGEVPALHALHAGQGVQGGIQLLLHLQANSPPWGRLPEAEGDSGWQSHWDTTCPHPAAEGGDPGRRRRRAGPEERGPERGAQEQQPAHRAQPPAAPAGAARPVSWRLVERHGLSRWMATTAGNGPWGPERCGPLAGLLQSWAGAQQGSWPGLRRQPKDE